MKYKKTKCPICGTNDNYDVLYPRNFKDSDFNTKIFSARRLPDRKHYQIVKCRKCGLVRSSPVTDSKLLKNLYQKSILTYDDEIKNLTDTYFECLKPVLAKLPKSANILEIGCGNGFILEKIASSGFKNVYGVEPSTDAVKKASPKIRKNITTDIFKKNLFPQNKFKLIFLFQTLDHIPNPNEFLTECHRILDSNGSLLAFNHNVESLSAKILREKSPIIDIEHTVLYSPKTIRTIFEKNHFKVNLVYSPPNILSLRHLLWLFPLPQTIKKSLINSSSTRLNQHIKLKLGNLCIIAQKS